MKLTVSLSQQKNIKANFDKFEEEVNLRMEQFSEVQSRDIERNAKRLAPVDIGKLRQNISWVRPIKRTPGVFENIIQALMPYSAYQEFGTGGLVDVPPGWEDIAIKFKGKGVKQINMKPQPFMWPAFKKQKITFLKDAKFILERLVKKYGG